MSEVEKAARNIDDALSSDARFPPLDKHLQSGASNDYDLTSTPEAAPFQRLKQHELPARILEQANIAGLNMRVGVFGPLGHAWVILDNAFYLWDYTLPNPDLIGWEESERAITSIKLVKPKPGVFVKEIEHLIVVVTDQDMTLLGVALQTSDAGAKTVALYNTRMSINVSRLGGVRLVEAAENTGRIFFCTEVSDDLYEFTYNQDEGWFSGRTNCVCHTKSGISFVQESVLNVTRVGHYFRQPEQRPLLLQMAIDETRDLMYTLSTNNIIKIWALRPELVIAGIKPLFSLVQGAGTITGRTELLMARDVRIVSVSPIPVTESRMLGLMATLNTGCRLYLEVSCGFEPGSASHLPTGVRILHIRFPPTAPTSDGNVPQSAQTAITSPSYSNTLEPVDIFSHYLMGTSNGERFPPGYFMAFLPDETPGGKLFCSAPDVARLKNVPDSVPVANRFVESAVTFQLSGNVCQLVQVNGNGGATSTTEGFGNELAVQFDRPSAEIAIVTNDSIQTIRRRRLVDVFASMLRTVATDEEARDQQVHNLIRGYGRPEVVATALAVACGQGMDVTSDSRLSSVTDPEVLESARKVFVSHGGRPEYNANAVTAGSGSGTDSVEPSPRHRGTALFLSRLIRSLWTVKVISQEVTPVGGVKQIPGVKLEKLRKVQRDLNALSEFLSRAKTFIRELSEGAALGGARSRKEEIEIRA